MTKKEIVKKISEEAKLTQLKTKEIVQMTFDAIIETLIAEGRIELRNFGVFEVKRRKPRRARNPRTNKPVEVEAKNVVTFQPGKVMEEKVRRMGTVPQTTGKRKTRKSEEPIDDDDEPATVGANASLNGTAHDFAGEQELPLKPR